MHSNFKIIIITLLFLLIVTSAFFIGFCLYSIYKSKHLFKRPSILFILNILLVHLYQSIIVLPLYAGKKYKFEDFYTARVVCDAFRFTYLISYYCSIYSVLLIAIDRFIATHYKIKYKHFVTKSKILVLICLMWGYVMSLCLIPFVQESKDIKVNLNSTRNYPICTYKPAKEWSSFMLIGNCIVPYIILLVLYKSVAAIVAKFEVREIQRRQSCSSANTNVVIPLETQDNKENQSITKLAIVLAIAYFILWSPSLFYQILRSFCRDVCFPAGFDTSPLEEYLGFATKYMAFLDSIAAPVIYCVCHEEIWSQFRKTREQKRKFSINLLMDTDRFHHARESVI